MRKAPCINARQSWMQEAPTDPPGRVCSLSIAGPPGNIKMEERILHMHTQAEYARNEREMLALYKSLPWKEQVIFIGRLQYAAEQVRAEGSGKVIQFPAAARELAKL